VSSIPDANTVFEGRKMIGQRKKRDRRENKADKRRYTERKTLKRDHRIDNREEIKELLRDTTTEGHNTL
jgi:hypothetical protein